MTNLYEWSARWGIPQAAIDELRAGTLQNEVANRKGLVSEAGVQARARMQAMDRGSVLWRNNVGAMQDETGRVVRFGLCNESKAMNQKTKSSDLIGITSVLVTPELVGRVLGIFTAVECKAPGWRYTGNQHEEAQRHFGVDVVQARGGIFKFTT